MASSLFRPPSMTPQKSTGTRYWPAAFEAPRVLPNLHRLLILLFSPPRRTLRKSARIRMPERREPPLPRRGRVEKSYWAEKRCLAGKGNVPPRRARTSPAGPGVPISTVNAAPRRSLPLRPPRLLTSARIRPNTFDPDRNDVSDSPPVTHSKQKTGVEAARNFIPTPSTLIFRRDQSRSLIYEVDQMSLFYPTLAAE